MSQHTNRFTDERIRDVINFFLDCNHGGASPECLDEMLGVALRLPLKPYDMAIVLEHAVNGAMRQDAFGHVETARAIIEKHLPLWLEKSTGAPNAPPHFFPRTLNAMAALRNGPSEGFLNYAEKAGIFHIRKFLPFDLTQMYSSLAHLAIKFDAPFMDALGQRARVLAHHMSGDDLYHLLHNIATIDAVATAMDPKSKLTMLDLFADLTQDKIVLTKLSLAATSSHMGVLRDAYVWFTNQDPKCGMRETERGSPLEGAARRQFEAAGCSILTKSRIAARGHKVDIALVYRGAAASVECDGEDYHFNRWPNGIIRLDGASVYQTLLNVRDVPRERFIRLPENFVNAHEGHQEGWDRLAQQIHDVPPGGYIVTNEGELTRDLLIALPRVQVNPP